MDYKKQIDVILEGALQEKTFSLEAVEKIKELRDKFLETELELKSMCETADARYKENTRLDGVISKLREEIKVFTEKEEQVARYLIEKDKLEYQLEGQRSRADEIKEMFGIVFKNPVMLKSVTGNKGHLDNNNCQQSTIDTSNERKEIE